MDAAFAINLAKSNKEAPMIKGALGEKLYAVLTSGWWGLVFAVLTILALLAEDFVHAFMYQIEEIYTGVFIVLLICLFGFLIEMIAQSIVIKGTLLVWYGRGWGVVEEREVDGVAVGVRTASSYGDRFREQKTYETRAARGGAEEQKRIRDGYRFPERENTPLDAHVYLCPPLSASPNSLGALLCFSSQVILAASSSGWIWSERFPSGPTYPTFGPLNGTWAEVRRSSSQWHVLAS